MADCKDSLESICDGARQFCRMRAGEIEKEYYREHGDEPNFHRRNELYDRILRLLGENGRLLVEFADRDAACYNPDTDYFYQRGFEDGLLYLRTLERVGGEPLPGRPALGAEEDGK